jgi:hypothetical protein
MKSKEEPRISQHNEKKKSLNKSARTKHFVETHLYMTIYIKQKTTNIKNLFNTHLTQ